MFISRLLISIYIIFISFITFATNIELIHIQHFIIDFNKYEITFALNNQTNYQIISKDNKIIIDFTDTKFSVKDVTNKLDRRFVKKIFRSDSTINDLKIIIELSQNAKLESSYSISHNEQLFLTLEITNSEINSNEIEKKDINLKNFTIMIDPGHGGKDQGTVSPNLNLLEKDITLIYATELYNELSKYPNYKILMTREEDIFLSPEQRKKKMREMKVDLFISLHVDFNPDSKLKGASVYTLSQEVIDKESLILSNSDNKEILKSDGLLESNQEIASMLVDMLYKDTYNSSVNLAKTVAHELGKEVYMLENSHRLAELKVLKTVDTPAILIELGCFSNKEEEYLLNTVQHKKIFTQALIQGINKYLISTN